MQRLGELMLSFHPSYIVCEVQHFYISTVFVVVVQMKLA